VITTISADNTVCPDALELLIIFLVFIPCKLLHARMLVYVQFNKYSITQHSVLNKRNDVT